MRTVQIGESRQSPPGFSWHSPLEIFMTVHQKPKVHQKPFFSHFLSWATSFSHKWLKVAKPKKMCFGLSRLNPNVQKNHAWDFGVILACFKNSGWAGSTRIFEPAQPDFLKHVKVTPKSQPWARGGKGLYAAAARQIPVGRFLHCILFLGVPRGILILVSRSLLCSGSCPFAPQKTLSFWKVGGSSRK